MSHPALEKNPNAPLEDVVLTSTMKAYLNNENVIEYLFRHLEELFDYALTTKYCDFSPKTANTTPYYMARNICQILAPSAATEKLGKRLVESEYVTERLLQYLKSMKEGFNPSTCSHFCNILKALISITKGEYIKIHPEFFFPFLNNPQLNGFSNLLFTILMHCPDLYPIAAERCSEFMRMSKKNEQYYENSFTILNIFSRLYNSKSFNKDAFTVDCAKNLLDATLFSIKSGKKVAFYEGIRFLSSTIRLFDRKSAIARYVKARGKSFYKQHHLYEMEITPTTELNDDLKICVESFPAFFASGASKLYPLLFRPVKPVSGDFGKAFLDYIVSLDETKYANFIDNNNIVELIQKYLPPFPIDEALTESYESIQYTNPHVILLALYIFEGLPSRFPHTEELTDRHTIEEGDETEQNIIPNRYHSESTATKEFSNFVIERVLPYRKLILNFAPEE
ncbi:hypothetical protein TRFO_11327 [Tritrichomonas foetus]|uniref:Uncharacterized protein n=1 Tax=Tritrichomonas foetus TaxID=1144522 RepID=A0A1J4J4E2_9EUKA|nr:hypothetical protein TRFO_11327 [Tritrichomonas foetus]|eukprot:OHS94238.1 hypothetical protein TRFO_11327 [Tritrichomonas foetus]